MQHRVCPWWLGYLLASPLRRLWENPEEVLRPYVNEGMNVLDVGSGMGFFSLPMAKMVGETGRVVCVDLQDKMIKGLIRKVKKAGLAERIDARTCSQGSLGLNDLAGKIDFALAYALAHEVPDKERLFSEIYATLKPSARFLLAEPRGHVSEMEFNKTVSVAQKAGFEELENVKMRRSHAIVLQPR